MLVFGGISLKLASLLCSLPSKHSRSFAIIGRLERQNMRKERERELVVKEETPSKLNGWTPENEVYFQNDGVFLSSIDNDQTHIE